MPLNTWAELWDRLTDACGLPAWFGRNLDAWWDTLRGGLSDDLDTYTTLTILVARRGLFAEGAEGEAFIETTNESDWAKVEVESPPTTR